MHKKFSLLQSNSDDGSVARQQRHLVVAMPLFNCAIGAVRIFWNIRQDSAGSGDGHTSEIPKYENFAWLTAVKPQ